MQFLLHIGRATLAFCGGRPPLAPVAVKNLEPRLHAVFNIDASRLGRPSGLHLMIEHERGSGSDMREAYQSVHLGTNVEEGTRCSFFRILLPSSAILKIIRAGDHAIVSRKVPSYPHPLFPHLSPSTLFSPSSYPILDQTRNLSFQQEIQPAAL
jgi:hypothetical protein